MNRPREESPCRSCRQDETCETVCDWFALWFGEHWHRLRKKLAKKKCRTCRWHDEFSWVCFNGDSPDVADFTDPEHICDAWEEKNDEE